MCSLFYSLVSLLVTHNSRSWNRCPQRFSRPRTHTLFHDLFPPISWTTFPYRSRYLGYTMPFFSVIHLLGLKSLNDRGSSLRPPLGCHLPRPSLLRPCRPAHFPLPTAHCPLPPFADDVAFSDRYLAWNVPPKPSRKSGLGCPFCPFCLFDAGVTTAQIVEGVEGVERAERVTFVPAL